MSGRLDLDARHLKLKKFDIDFGAHKLLTHGEFKQSKAGDWETVRFRGKSLGSMDINNLLDIWPNNLASGARRWVDRSMINAAIKNINFSLDLPQNYLFGNQSLNDDDFSLKFDVTNANVKYISTQFSGTGNIQLKVKRPLLENFDRSRIDYAVSGKFNNISAPFSIGNHKLKNGFVDLFIDKKTMSISGPVFIGPWKANLSLNETFSKKNPHTRYVVEGEMNRDTLDGFGLGFRKNLKGKLYTKIEAEGKGFNLSNAKLNII